MINGVIIRETKYFAEGIIKKDINEREEANEGEIINRNKLAFFTRNSDIREGIIKG